jgi:hypothetical protein
MPKLSDYPDLTKEDLEDLHIIRFYYIIKRSDLPGMDMEYSTGEYMTDSYKVLKEECPICEDEAYYHEDRFNHHNNLPSICIICSEDLGQKARYLPLMKLNEKEQKCKNKFGEDIFDRYITPAGILNISDDQWDALDKYNHAEKHIKDYIDNMISGEYGKIISNPDFEFDPKNFIGINSLDKLLQITAILDNSKFDYKSKAEELKAL